MRIKFLVRDELDESTIRKTLEPILTGIERTTHKVAYRTSIGVVEYVSMPLGSSMNRYSDANVSGTLRKISLWNRDSTDELEKMLRSKGIRMTEIAKDGPKTLELKK
jgi:hypothetical protein